MATLHEQSSDILVRGRPIGLSERDPEIFHDYAISRDTAISIMPSMEALIADPTFRHSVRETLRCSPTLVEIKVSAKDGTVFVKDPRNRESRYQPVDYEAKAAVQKVARRTQAAYDRLIGSPSSSRRSYPPRVASPVYDHAARTARPRSYQHIPSPTFQPEFYESRIHDLERENRELRGRVENLELRGQLERSEQLCRDTMRQLSESQDTVRELQDTVAALLRNLEGEQEAHQRTNESLAASVLINIILATALQGMGGRNAELQRQLEELQAQHRALGVHSEAHDHILQTAQELTEASSPDDLISKIKDLQAALASEQERSRGLEHALSQSEEERRSLQSRLEAADRELRQLRPENAELRRDLEKARQELAEIARAVSGGLQSGETLPQLAKRYHETIARLEGQLDETLQANRGLQEIIRGIRSELPHAPERDADLPGAIRALRQSQEEADLARQALHDELEALKLQHSGKVAILDRIGEVLDKKGEPHESLPELVSALEGENRELKERIATHVAAQARRDEILARVGELTGERIETIEDLPSAVQSALGKVEQRAVAANRRADSLQDRVSALTEELKETQRAHKQEIAAKKEEVRAQELRALQAESDLLGQDERVLELEDQAEALRRECGKATRALREAEKRHAGELSELRSALHSAVQDLGQERETTVALRKEVAALKQAAHDTELRHQEALRKQEVAHRQEITPLRERLAEVTLLTEEQSRRIASLEEELLAAHEATRVSDQRRERELRELEEAHQGVLAPLKAQLERAEAALSEATSTEESQQASILALTKEVATLKATLEERAQISSEELQRLREESEHLRALLGQIDEIARKVPIERDPRSLAEELEELRQGPQYDKLPGEVKEVIAALLKEIRELKAKDLAVREKEATIADLELQLEDQEARSSEKQAALHAQIESLNVDLLQVRNEAFDLGQKQAHLIGTLRETLRKQRQEAAIERTQKLERISELEEDVRKAERTIKTLRHTIEQQGIKLQGETDRADHYESYSEELRAEKKKLQLLIKSLRKALTEMERDRDSWREETGQYAASYRDLRREHTELQGRCGHLEEEVAQLRQILATTFSVEPTLNVEQFREARRELQGRIADMEQTIEGLSEKVVRVERSKARVEARHEKAAEERDAALRKAAESERQRKLEEQRRLSTESSRDRLLEDLDGAHQLASSQARQLEATLGSVKELRAENAHLREALEAHRHSSAEQEEILQRAIAEKAEELRRLQEAEEARRREELDAVEQQQLRAADAGEIMGEIARGMEDSGLTLDGVIPPKMLAWIKEYVQSMKTGALPKRHAQAAASEISQLNKVPYPLSNLSLFTDFFQVTDDVSELRGSREFLRLKANNAILAQLNPETQQETIKRIKAENAAIIGMLLRGFFARVNKVAGPGSKLSRFGNIGMQLWIWNTVFHGLKDEFYQESTQKAELGFTSSFGGVDLQKADGMRKTVLDLHTRFQEMMRPFVPA